MCIRDSAKAAGVPIIVAVNKIDLPDANPDRVKQELTEHGLVCEDWGGDTIVVPVSAKTHQGLETPVSYTHLGGLYRRRRKDRRSGRL